MGVSANPAMWFVAVAFLVAARFGLKHRKEILMQTTKSRRKAHMKPAAFEKSALALGETLWAIATNIVAGLVTLLIHRKGAPVSG
jgi:hypothetical protein